MMGHLMVRNNSNKLRTVIYVETATKWHYSYYNSYMTKLGEQNSLYKSPLHREG